MISVCFQGKPFNIMIIQVYALTNNAEEAEVEWFYEDIPTRHISIELTKTKLICSALKLDNGVSKETNDS